MKLSFFFLNKTFLTVCLSLFSVVLFAQDEICDNGIDDDGDGLVDCLDPDCIDSFEDCPAFSFPGSCLPIGYYPDITGTDGGFKAGGDVSDVTIPIPASTNRASVIIQGVYQQAVVDFMTGVNDLNHAQERIIWGRVELDLDLETSSGWVEYQVNNHESKRYSWVDQPMSAAGTDTYTRVGHDFAELLDFEFVFDTDGTNLILGCSELDIDVSYYSIFYGNFDSQSMTSIPGADPTQYPTYFDAGPDPINLTRTIDMLTGADAPDFVQIRAIGINQNRRGHSGVLVQDTREEAMSIKYMIIDLTTMRASGNMTVNNGNIADMATTFSFSDYDVTSGLSIVSDATLLGDFDGNTTPPDQIAVCDMTLEIVGDQLVMTRSDEHGGDFNEIYYVEFLRYSDQPYSSSFYITENAYSGPADIGYDFGGTNDGVGVPGYVDFTIPQGSKRGYLEIRANGLYAPFRVENFEGPAPTNTERTNGNQMYAFTEVNFDLEETTGFFVTITTATEQQLYAWQEIPIDPLVDITDLAIYGQLPNNDERLNFEIIPPNTFRVHLENDKIAYERILNMTFLGSKVNLVYSTFEFNDEATNGCDSVYFDMEMCNSGGTDLTIPVPVSFYTSDPTVDAGAIYLQTAMYDLDIDQGQCETFTFGIDISSLGGSLIGDIAIVLNDDGSFAGLPGDVIPAIFSAEDLGAQDSPVLECEYNYNIITSDYEIVLPPRPTIDFNQDLFTICPSQEALIIGTPDGETGAVSYDWSPIPGATDRITVSPDATTWYYLTIEDECHVVTDSVKVEIGTVDVSRFDVVEAEVCPGQPGLLGSITIVPDDPDWIYTMSGDGAVVGPTGDNYFPDLTGGIFYLINVTDEDGCTLDTAIFVGLGDNEVFADFNLDSLRDVTCFGSGDGGAFVENITGGILPPFSVQWSTIAGPFDTNGGIPDGGSDDIDNLFGGRWIVTVTDEEGCAWSRAFTIFEPEELTIDFIYNDPSCFGFSDGSVTIQSDGGNGDNIFEIRNADGELLNVGNSNTANGLGEGTYYSTVTDKNGCTISGTVTLNEPEQLDIDLETFNPECYGYNTGLAVVTDVYNFSGAYEDLTYIWAPSPSGENGRGADSSRLLTAGEYTVTINDENGCSNVFTFEISQPDSLQLVEFGQSPAFCRLFDHQSGNGILFAAATGGSGNKTYYWDNLDDETSTINTTWGGLNPGNYQLTVVDTSGCVLNRQVSLDSLNPIANFTMTSDEFTENYKGTAPVSVHFVNTSLNFANPIDPLADTNFFWYFDIRDGVLSQDYYETYDTTYALGGDYEVCLVAINKNGCMDRHCKILNIYDPLVFNEVNVFTPDGDGVNDGFSFEFRSDAVSEFKCVIVNRWGITMYEMNDINDSWDGTTSGGLDCKAGVYFYNYEGKADNSDPFSGQGTIHLVR